MHFREIRNVWYVPGLSVNIISAQGLKRTGAYYMSKSGSMDEWWFDRDNQLFLFSPHSNGLNVPDWILLPATQTARDGTQTARDGTQPLSEDVMCLFSSSAIDSHMGMCFFSDPTHATEVPQTACCHQMDASCPRGLYATAFML
jgi:hypothetical protein